MSTDIGAAARTPEPPAYEQLVPVSEIAAVVLCNNPSIMTFEGTNSYVLRGPDSAGSVVIDPGPEQHEHLVALAEAGQQVELVLITHHHFDHTDGIDAFYRQVSAPTRAIRPEYCRTAPPVVDGEKIRAAGLEIEVLATPGHTADSLCLLVRRPGAETIEAIVLGDTILGRDSTVLTADDGDLAAYLESLAALAHHGSGVIGLPGHGPIVRDTAAFARHLDSHRRERLEQVRTARAELGSNATVTELTRHIYTDVEPHLLVVAEQSTTVALRYLERQQ